MDKCERCGEVHKSVKDRSIHRDGSAIKFRAVWCDRCVGEVVPRLA